MISFPFLQTLNCKRKSRSENWNPALCIPYVADHCEKTKYKQTNTLICEGGASCYGEKWSRMKWFPHGLTYTCAILIWASVWLLKLPLHEKCSCLHLNANPLSGFHTAWFSWITPHYKSSHWLCPFLTRVAHTYHQCFKAQHLALDGLKFSFCFPWEKNWCSKCIIGSLSTTTMLQAPLIPLKVSSIVLGTY